MMFNMFLMLSFTTIASFVYWGAIEGRSQWKEWDKEILEDKKRRERLGLPDDYDFGEY